MPILWMNFIVVYFSSLAARFFSKPKDLQPFVKPNKLLIFLAMSTLVVISGLRRNIGDTYFYMHAYTMKFSWQGIDFHKDFGFYIFEMLLHDLSSNPQILVFTTALITNVLIVLVLYRYSRMIEISLFIYIAFGMFTVSMNGIRQSLAAAIIFAATKYLLNGDWKKFMSIVLLAATIHRSALIFIPIYLIVRGRAWTKLTFFLLLIGVAIVFEFNTFSNMLFSALDHTEYGHYSNFSEGGANVLRAVVTAVPLFAAYIGREKLRAMWPKSDVIVNLSLLGLIFMIVATKSWIFARFDIYFGLYSLILISWVIQLFKKKERQFIYYALLVCYLVYFYYDQVMTLGIQYRSDYFHWLGW